MKELWQLLAKVKLQIKQLFIKVKGQNEGHGQKSVCQHEGLVPIVNMCEYESNWWSNEEIATIIQKGQRSNEGQGHKFFSQHKGSVTKGNVCEYELNRSRNKKVIAFFIQNYQKKEGPRPFPASVAEEPRVR